MPLTVQIVEFGLGNIASAVNALEHIGFKVRKVSSGSEISRQPILIPGVGSFGTAMKELRLRGLEEAIAEKVLEDKVPILGICLGAQLLGLFSDESPGVEGLGLLQFRSVALEPDNSPSGRVPNVGFFSLERDGGGELFEGIGRESTFYFSHSYRLSPKSRDETFSLRGTSDGYVIAGVQAENVMAVQFHPEKSRFAGLQVLRNFRRVVTGF